MIPKSYLATEARNDFFKIITRVATTGVPVRVEKKDAGLSVRIVPEEAYSVVSKSLLSAALDRAYGIWKDLPDSYFEEINERVRGKKEMEYIRKLRRGET